VEFRKKEVIEWELASIFQLHWPQLNPIEPKKAEQEVAVIAQ